MKNLIQYVEEQTARETGQFDYFKAGDTVSVTYKIIEGQKEREQTFRGTIIQVKGTGVTKTFTIRKISHGVGIERIFPFNCPTLVSIVNHQKGRVRRARLYYLRNAIGKAGRVKEKTFVKRQTAEDKGRKYSWTFGNK